MGRGREGRVVRSARRWEGEIRLSRVIERAGSRWGRSLSLKSTLDVSHDVNASTSGSTMVPDEVDVNSLSRRVDDSEHTGEVYASH
jgi:hypothetical protein